MQTIYLEFKRETGGSPAVNGSDIVFFIDGRWSWDTTREKIADKVAELREVRGSRYKDQLFVGFTYASAPDGAIHTMRDFNPPAWFTDEWVSRHHEFKHLIRKSYTTS